MSNASKKSPIGRCKENHKNNVYQCNLVTDQIQKEFNNQYWSFNKANQDDCILKSVKVVYKLNSTELDYKYFIFGYQVCSQMFTKTLGFRTRSRIEYFFRKLKKTNSLNSLSAPADGRKKNRVKNRSHNRAFLNDLISFVKSFKLVKKNRNKFIIEDYKPIDLFKILCEKLNYELIYENKSLKTRKKVQLNSSNLESYSNRPNIHQQNFNQQNSNLRSNIDSNTTMINEYCDDSMNYTNGSILLINEVTSSQLTQQQQSSNQNENNFYLFNQSINRINSQTSRSINQSISAVQNKDQNVEQANCQPLDHNFQTDQICSYSYFLRFLKKHNFEFK